jgi:hypothetical protein
VRRGKRNPKVRAYWLGLFAHYAYRWPRLWRRVVRHSRIAHREAGLLGPCPDCGTPGPYPHVPGSVNCQKAQRP